ncbi:MAG: GNAT family N-acetyltransferase [Sulfitobacter sp.]
MTPDEMAQIHAIAFAPSRGWQTEEFASLLSGQGIQVFTAPHGFAVTRTLAGESELITLAVSPEHQRRGIALSLLKRWLEAVAAQAETAFLDVAADNDAALALYHNLSFERSGLRKGYYARAGGPAVDAVLMKRASTQG